MHDMLANKKKCMMLNVVTIGKTLILIYDAKLLILIT